MNKLKENPLFLAIKRFNRFRGTTLAAASSFYFFLTIVPMALLFARALGFIFGDLNSALDRLFIVATSFFPGFTTEFLLGLKGIVRTALFGPAPLTLINFVFLLAGSLSFVNSLWTGVYLLTQDRSFLSWRNYFRGVALLGISSAFVTALFLLPSLYVSIIRFLQKSSVMDFFLDVIPGSRELFFSVAQTSLDQAFLLKSDAIALILFIVFFTFAFHWLFKWRLRWQDSAIVGLCFSLSLFILRRFFGLYLTITKQSLLSQYGHLYTIVVVLLWVYVAMCAFFVMIALGSELLERRRALVETNSKGYHNEQVEGESFDSSAD